MNAFVLGFVFHGFRVCDDDFCSSGIQQSKHKMQFPYSLRLGNSWEYTLHAFIDGFIFDVISIIIIDRTFSKNGIWKWITFRIFVNGTEKNEWCFRWGATLDAVGVITWRERMFHRKHPKKVITLRRVRFLAR